jgi:transposase InsO family protein
MDKKLKKIYYSEGGYWRGLSAVGKLAKAAGVSKIDAEAWLKTQPTYQIYLPAPKYIPRPNASHSLFLKPNEIHQADILYLPHDKYKRKTYKYALCIVDVASRYKAAYQMTSKSSAETAAAIQYIYETTPLTYPALIMVDEGKEFYGDTGRLMKKYGVQIQRGDPTQHRSQGIVERFNRTLAEKLFSYQYHKDINDGGKNTEWVARLQGVVDGINGEVTRIIGKKPVDAVEMSEVYQGFSLPRKHEEEVLDVGTKVRYLYEDGELEGGGKRATDPIWSMKVYKVIRRSITLSQPTLYYLDGGPERYFVREELQVIDSG